ncbi:MAG: glycosyltransferase [Lachnospiraceae bacterium]
MLSVCIITKNEEKKLRQCLEQLQPYPFEIVVVDTGSTDNSVKTAMEFTEKVFFYPWNHDFSAARNFAAQKASWDMIFTIDSDEYLESIDVTAVLKIVTEHSDEVGRIWVKNKMNFSEEMMNRELISRIYSRKRFCYSGRIHEQLISLSGEEAKTYQLPLSILHDGYSGTKEEKYSKMQRNRMLIEMELQEKGEDPYLLYQAGKSCFLAGDFQGAADFFADALAYDLDTKLEYVIDLVESYGYALLNSGHAKEALSFLNIADTFGNTADFRCLLGLILMNNEMFDDAILEFIRATQNSTYRVEGTNSYLAFYNAGVIEECRGNIEKAIIYYDRCKTYTKAKERLAAIR